MPTFTAALLGDRSMARERERERETDRQTDREGNHTKPKDHAFLLYVAA